jgi:trehalose 6-phosphate phosphatase
VNWTAARDLAAANDGATAVFTRLDPQAIALLLDVDGTIIDLASTPHEVHVPNDLCRALERLLQRTGGALALVSGRPIADLDRLFSPLKLPAVGGHGAETRVNDEHIKIQALPEAFRRRLFDAKKIDPGIVVEDKGYSFALHYRNAPQCEDELRRHVTAACAAFPGETIEILPGKAMFEVKRPDISKGVAVRALMARPPFAGRKPVFIGDDVTDESVFAMLAEFDGIGFSVHRHFTGVNGIFQSPEHVRGALQMLAERAQRASAR